MNRKDYAMGIYRSSALNAFATRRKLTKAEAAEKKALEAAMREYETKYDKRAAKVLSGFAR